MGANSSNYFGADGHLELVDEVELRDGTLLRLEGLGVSSAAVLGYFTELSLCGLDLDLHFINFCSV